MHAKTISDPHVGESFKTWRPAFSIGFVLATYFAVYIWTAPSSTDGIQQPVFAEESRHRELGVVLRSVTDPDRTAIVPADAIQRDRVGKFVFVRSVKRENVLVRHSVVTERLRDGQMRILHGLHSGEQLVVSGAERLRAEPDIHSKPSESVENTRLGSQSGNAASKK
jgi:multidrug efflux pump subunit AcrA (membrane-fusion protein)